jgi:RNA polymerase sigma-70 factor, ECF subfamily
MPGWEKSGRWSIVISRKRTGDGMITETDDFQRIHDEYRPQIYRYLCRLVGEADAEDLAQEVFLKVDKALKGFRGKSSLSTWIYRIATNTALDRLRSRSSSKGEMEGLSSDGELEVEDKDTWTGKEKPSLETSLIRKEMNDCIRGIVDSLPANYRTVIALGEVEGFTNAEIAEILGVSLDAVKIRLHRARARLKGELQKNCSFYRDERNELACDRVTPSLKFLDK